MSTAGTKTKKGKAPKPPTGRPQSTSAHTHAAPAGAGTAHILSAFSPRADYLALVSRGADRHRLRVYDASTGSAVGDYACADRTRITALSWGAFAGEDADGAEADGAPAAKRKRRRKSAGAAAVEAMIVDEPAAKATTQVVILGLSSGALVLFSPTHGRVTRTISHASPSAEITSAAPASEDSPRLWTASVDGTLRLWSIHTGELLGSWKTPQRATYSALAVRPGDDPAMLGGHHTLQLLETPIPSDGLAPVAQEQAEALATCTGHASAVRSLAWMSPERCLSSAEADRFVSVWHLPSDDDEAMEGTLVASIGLDADVRHFSVTKATTGASAVVLAVSTAGRLSIHPLPDTLPSATGKKQKVVPLPARSTIAVVPKKGTQEDVLVVDACFVPEDVSRVRIARLVGGVRPLFDDVQYLDASGSHIPEITVTHDDSGLPIQDEVAGAAPTKRYTESSSLAVRSGALDLGLDPSTDDLATRDPDGTLDADLAELSLGQRLAAADPTTGAGLETPSEVSDSDAPSVAAGATTGKTSRSRRRRPKNDDGDTREAVPAGSLTRTLIQALHSSDARLLETCLAHSDPALIRNTVRALPPQLALPLLDACMERLGRGARAGNAKGGGGGASSQRGTGMIGWVKAVLAVHSAHLMTMPDLVARLAGLHATLTARLALQESLLTLSGRLDMVLSQIEMRASAAPAPVKGKPARGQDAEQKREVARYVEGESEDDEDAGMEVEVESGDDAGSVEDVELGGSEDEDDEESAEDTDEGEDNDVDSDGSGPRLNGFIDDEAEEYSSESEEEESE